MAYCQRCGAALVPQANFCGGCGSPSAQAVSPAVGISHAPEVGPPPQAFDAEALFVGKNAGFYRLRWSVPGQGATPSWNWAAFFLGLSWMAYRKMWRYATIVLGVTMLITFGEYLFDVSDEFAWFTTLIMVLAFGAYGNHAYQLHVREKVRSIMATVPPERVAAELARQGGTTVGGAIAFTVAVVVLSILEILVYEAIFY